MNERIAQLAEQAAQEANENDMALEVISDDKTYQIPAGFIEKFSELIVRECVKCCDEIADINKVYREERLVDPEFGPKECIETIKEHFGVE